MKRTYKKISAFLFLIILGVIAFTSCGQEPAKKTLEPKESAAFQQIYIVTTSFPPYDFARQIAKDNAKITMLLPPGAEVHSYEPTPQDIITIQNCDLFIYVGGENDVWVDEVLQSMGTQAPSTLQLTDCVELIQEQVNEKHSDHTHFDQHVWTSPQNAVKIVEKMTSLIAATDPSHQLEYEQNAAVYIKQLEALDKEFQNLVDSAKRKTIIVGDRFPFQYFVDTYNLTYYAAFPSCSTNAEPSAATIAFLTDQVKKEDIPVVFYIEFSNHQIADSIAEATKTETMLLHSCHNVSKKEMSAGATYLSLMQQNLKALNKALN